MLLPNPALPSLHRAIATGRAKAEQDDCDGRIDVGPSRKGDHNRTSGLEGVFLTDGVLISLSRRVANMYTFGSLDMWFLVPPHR